jgi:hypothetical protein
MKELQMREVYKTGKRYEDISLEEAPPDDNEICRVESEIYGHLDNLFFDLRHYLKIETALDMINAFVSLVNEQQGVK